MSVAGSERGLPEGEIPERLRRSVRAVLLSSPKGVLLRKFCQEYRELAKEQFPWKSLGYSSPADLLKVMPSVARWQYSDKEGEYRIFGVVDNTSYLPSWLKKFERRAASVPPSSSVATGQEVPAVTSSSSSVKRSCGKEHQRGRKRKGLVTVHVSFRHGPGNRLDETAATASTMQRKLPEVMKSAGKPKDIFVSQKGYGFVRFATMAEAQKAIQMFSKTYIGKTWVVVSIARESQSLLSDRERGVAKESQPFLNHDERGLTTGDMVGTAGRERGTVEWSEPAGGERVDGAMSTTTESSDSWDDELLTSSPFHSNNTDVECGPSLNADSTSSDMECNRASLQLSPHSIPNSNGHIPVHVSQVESPSLVWVQLTSDPESDVVNISQYISALKPAKLTKVSEGGVQCLGLVTGGYRRVQVVQFDNCVAQQQASVLEVDTGNSQTVPCSQLFQLPPSLALSCVPPLAMPCRLADISSSLGEEKWFFYDNQLLWRLIMKKKVYVKKVPQSQNSFSETYPNTSHVTVEMYLDPCSNKSVSSLLVSSGMHVRFSDQTLSQVTQPTERMGLNSVQRVVNHSLALTPLPLPAGYVCDIHWPSASPETAQSSPSPPPPPLVSLTPPSRDETPPSCDETPPSCGETLPTNIHNSPFLRLKHLLSTLTSDHAT